MLKISKSFFISIFIFILVGAASFPCLLTYAADSFSVGSVGIVVSDLPLSVATEEALSEAHAIGQNALSHEETISIPAGGNIVTDTTTRDTGASGTGAESGVGLGVQYSVSQRDGKTVYLFGGVEYTLGESTGVHKISGYSTAETGVSHTSMGTAPRARHTLAAASNLPLGTVILLEGVSGPDGELYDGMYVVEDRGGYYVESEGWMDIYFDSYEEAIAVTDRGWNYAEVYIMVPLD